MKTIPVNVQGKVLWLVNGRGLFKERPELRFDYIKTPLNHYTFKNKPIRAWVEAQCEGLVLNLFAGKTPLKVNEVRNDLDPECPADYHMDAFDLLTHLHDEGKKFDTIVLDPPYSLRKSMEYYDGRKMSKFRKICDAVPSVLNHGGRVITFGYSAVTMGKTRGFWLERVAVFDHSGGKHCTLASVERLVGAA